MIPTPQNYMQHKFKNKEDEQAWKTMPDSKRMIVLLMQIVDSLDAIRDALRTQRASKN